MKKRKGRGWCRLGTPSRKQRPVASARAWDSGLGVAVGECARFYALPCPNGADGAMMATHAPREAPSPVKKPKKKKTKATCVASERGGATSAGCPLGRYPSPCCLPAQVPITRHRARPGAAEDGTWPAAYFYRVSCTPSANLKSKGEEPESHTVGVRAPNSALTLGRCHAVSRANVPQWPLARVPSRSLSESRPPWRALQSCH